MKRDRDSSRPHRLGETTIPAQPIVHRVIRRCRWMPNTFDENAFVLWFSFVRFVPLAPTRARRGPRNAPFADRALELPRQYNTVALYFAAIVK